MGATARHFNDGFASCLMVLQEPSHVLTETITLKQLIGNLLAVEPFSGHTNEYPATNTGAGRD